MSRKNRLWLLPKAHDYKIYFLCEYVTSFSSITYCRISTSDVTMVVTLSPNNGDTSTIICHQHSYHLFQKYISCIQHYCYPSEEFCIDRFFVELGGGVDDALV